MGKSKKGELLFAYARLPGEKYIEPALSARMPVFQWDENDCKINIEVQNFGQVESMPAELKIICTVDNTEVEVAHGKVPKLKSFQKTMLKLNCASQFTKGEKCVCKVVIESEFQQHVIFSGEVNF